jgi:hypothetical protein
MEYLKFNSGVTFRIPINQAKLQEYGLTEEQLLEIVNLQQPEILKKWTTPMKESKGYVVKPKKVVAKTVKVAKERTL